MDLQPLAYNMRHLRRLRGWTMQRLANESGLSKTTIHRLEAGTITSETAGQVPLVADGLGVSVEQLTRWPALPSGPSTNGPIFSSQSSGTLASTLLRHVDASAIVSSAADLLVLLARWSTTMAEDEMGILTVAGDWLLPTFTDGEEIAVTLTSQEQDGKCVFAETEQGIVLGWLIIEGDRRLLELPSGVTVPLDGVTIRARIDARLVAMSRRAEKVSRQ